jgi:hypothetical protein
MPPMLDVETIEPSMKPVVLAERLKASVEQLEAMWGKKALIYTYPSFWNSLKLPQELSDFFGQRPLAIAQYNGDGYPWIPKTWSKAHFYQFDGDKGKVLPDHIDSDFDWWGSTEEELHAWCNDEEPTQCCYPNLDTQAGIEIALKMLVSPDVVKFQESQNLKPDGIVGPKTKQALQAQMMKQVWVK